MTEGSIQPLAPTRIRQKPTTSSKNTRWTQEEDNLLIQIVNGHEHVNWSEIANNFPTKTVQQVSERWSKVVNPSLIKGSWTRQEDETIIEFVKIYGVKNWTKLASYLPGRIGKQCRERWRNHLDPDVNRAPWSPEEDHLLLELHEQYGNQWVKISSLMPGRSDNQIKNRWNSTLRKRPADISVGCTPVTPNVKKVDTPSSAEVSINEQLFGDVPQPQVDLETNWTPRIQGFEVPSLNLRSPVAGYKSPSQSPFILTPWCGLNTPRELLLSPVLASPSVSSDIKYSLGNFEEQLDRAK